jgi:hypothetical protein
MLELTPDGPGRVSFELSWRANWIARIGRDPSRWRSRAAWWLRRLAQWVDGDRAVVVHCTSTPALPPEVADQCLAAGLRAGGALWSEMARQAGLEEAMRGLLPELYGADDA